jgi:type II secretory pathway pseudopilin PulG
MRRGVVVLVMGALLLAAWSSVASAQDQQLDWRQLRAEMTKNRRLSAYVSRNGCPDVARARFLSDEPPWDKYQVTLDYFGLHKEISFARAVVLGETSVHLEKDEHALSDQDIATLQSMPRQKCLGGIFANN